MRTTSSLALAFLLSSTAVIPASAQQAGWDGDWEGTWQCAANASAAAFTAPAFATISRGRVKASRATENNDEILNGTIDGGGTVVLTGRGIGPDGQPLLSSFSGTLSGRSLMANGRIVPQGGGAVQPCTLALAPAGSGGPGPVASRPYPAPTYYPPPVGYSDPYWYDDDYYWRRHRWDRWRRTHGRDTSGGGGHAARPLCPPGQMPSGGRCRVLSDAPPVTPPPTKPIGGGSTTAPPPPPPAAIPDKRYPAAAAPTPSYTPPAYTPPSYSPPSYSAPAPRDKSVPSYSPPPVARPAAPPPPPPPAYSPPPVKYSSPPPAPSYSPPPAPSYSPPEKSYSSPAPSPAPAPAPARSAPPPPPPPPPASPGCSGPKCPR